MRALPPQRANMMRIPPTAHRMHAARRTLRPPSFRPACPPAPRQFSHRPPRLLLASHRNVPRPQLPFLSSSAQAAPSGHRILRLFSITTNNKKYIKETAKLTVKYTFLIWVATTLFSIASLGVLSERQERAFPSPHEWSLYTRFRFRRGRWWEVPEHNEDHGFPNWARLYYEYQQALNRLEHPAKDGQGLVEQEADEGALLVPGIGRAGFDLTAKSGEWRQGYYEVIMGMGRAAERMEGWVSDKWKWKAWDADFVESEANPRPKMTPPGMPPIPAKEDQIFITDAPESFYMRILTAKGFNTNQRMTAALAYADWLSFKKLDDSAEEMYRWALDIAISGLPTYDPSSTISPDTAIISATAEKDTVTPNIINAATHMATFYASKGRLTSALPIYISVLRARLSAEPAPPLPPPQTGDSSLMGTLMNLLREPDYPPLPPTGDEPFRRREDERCEEAALKTYIGEILFATAGSSSAQRQQGLQWVRDGVSTAKIAQSLDVVHHLADRRKKCELCEEVGLESWGKIMTFLAAEARDKRDAAKAGGISNLQWKLWGTDALEKKFEDLEDEEEGVTMRLNKLRNRMLRAENEENDRKYARTFVF